jgi:hypothetical protein
MYNIGKFLYSDCLVYVITHTSEYHSYICFHNSYLRHVWCTEKHGDISGVILNYNKICFECYCEMHFLSFWYNMYILNVDKLYMGTTKREFLACFLPWILFAFVLCSYFLFSVHNFKIWSAFISFSVSSLCSLLI